MGILRFTAVLSFLAAAPSWAAEALPLAFVPNAGQLHASIRFMVQTPEVRAAFFQDAVAFQTGGVKLQVRFVGSNRAVELRGSGLLVGRVNFFTGADSRAWRTNLPTYARLIYRNLYPGIDAAYASSGRRMKSEFLVDPGADPHQIRMEYEGAVRMDGGELVVTAEGAELREDAPVAYQEDGTLVKAAFRFLEDGTVGFAIGDYDTTQPLVIDPVISYSTYLGGSGMGAVTGVAVDSAGNLYAAGWTEALDFPIAGALQAANRGGVDAFVVKLNPAGSSLIYATYIGGVSDDRAAAIAVDSFGQAHVAGATGSSNFPLLAPARSSMVGGKEAFALKLNPAGSALVYSTFLGGANWEAATAIAIDGAGAAHVAGDTRSADFAALNPVQSVLGGVSDVFVTKLCAAGAIEFSTFLGGSAEEHAGGIAIGLTGDAYISGGTFSTNFPLTAPLQGVNAGGQDAFLARIKTTAPTQLVHSGYLGGSAGSAAAPEQANAIALDAAGNIYLAGVTPSANFPVTGGTLQTTFNGFRDAFITKINAAGTVRLYSTYLGFTGFDWANGIGVDASGNAYVAGYTSSVSFANVGGVQDGFNGLYDAFVSKLNPAGNTLVFSTLYGGTGYDQANAIAVDASGNMFVGGQTSSVNFPLQAPIQSSNVGGSIGWIARLGTPAASSQLPSADSASITLGSANAVTVTAHYSHPAGAGALTEVAFLMGSSASVDFACYVKYDVALQLFTLANDLASSGGTDVTPGSGRAQNNQCVLNGAGSSAVLSGTQLVLTAALLVEPGFPGSNTIYLYAADASTNTGWVARGTFPRVSADSVSPASGTGASQTFTFVFSDTQNPLNVTAMAMLFNSSLTFTDSCYLVYERSNNRIKLLWDGANGANGKPLGSAATIQNSQCALGVATLTVSGTSNILSVPLFFKAPFNGAKHVYMLAAGLSNNTGWIERGTYTTLAPGIPMANSVAPSSGTGFGGLFTFTVSEAAGSAAITGMALLFAPTLNANNACYLIYDRGANRVSLSFDNISGSSPVVPGSATSVANSKCRLSGTNTSASFGATTVSLTVNLTFLPPFAGSKISYLYASEAGGVNSGWVPVGAWTVPDTASTVGTVTPYSGSGTMPTFTSGATTVVSPSNLTKMSLLITAQTAENACWVEYNRVTGTVGLYSDDALSIATKPMGSSATLQNSQCAVGFSSASVSGGAVSWVVNLLFKPAFSGSKGLYLSANTPTTATARLFRGTWTVP